MVVDVTYGGEKVGAVNLVGGDANSKGKLLYASRGVINTNKVKELQENGKAGKPGTAPRFTIGDHEDMFFSRAKEWARNDGFTFMREVVFRSITKKGGMTEREGA